MLKNLLHFKRNLTRLKPQLRLVDNESGSVDIELIGLHKGPVTAVVLATGNLAAKPQQSVHPRPQRSARTERVAVVPQLLQPNRFAISAFSF
ncbi:hypothetical protein EVAR_53959_1 [Eumeta japonica]|uniref:Uncharacterized protein n=1 Tax=Eumeta variegata TaxID=151549 RepID=A0A4C1XX55_EUMVA|nr:hypothetical protein EVAR_53959_1 [Eumeta japonica]